MSDPRTVNIGMIVPLTGSNVNLWADVALNPDFISLDGQIAGVQTIGVTNAPVTLTSPASYTPTPGPGPTQSQNRVLRFTGILTADVRITLPLPGSYIIENLTSGNFVLSFQGVTATEVVGTPQGERLEIYNDGANVRFVNLARMGAEEMWVGLIAVPAWVTACTVKPYLLEDGTIYNFSDYPALAARLLGIFGGNGVTTFAVPDKSGRVSLPYDKTGTRITVAGCGINGQTIGASIDQQTVSILQTNLPSGITLNGTAAGQALPGINVNNSGGTNGGQPYLNQASTVGGNTAASGIFANGGFTSPSSASVSLGGSGTALHNVQPSIVIGIPVIKT